MPQTVNAHGLDWDVTTTGLTAQRTADQVRFVNAADKTVWTFQTPMAQVGAAKAVPATVSVHKSVSGYVIHVAPPQPAAAHARGASYDPSRDASTTEFVAANSNEVVYYGQIIDESSFYAGGTSGNAPGDCYIDSSTPNDSLCGGDTDLVGPDDHMLLNFDVADSLPANAQILGADLLDNVVSQSSTTAENIGVWQAGDAWNNSATWNSYDGSNSWATAGGDELGTMLSEQSVGASGSVGGTPNWDITSAVQAWVDQTQPQNGLIVEPVSGTSAPNTIGFESLTGDQDAAPFIEVYYQARLGNYPNVKYDTQQLTNESSEGVNVANGNLLLSNNDVNLAGVNGLGLSLGRYFNNQSSADGAFGTGWTMGAGQDSYLVIPNDGQQEIYDFDGSGNGQPFTFDPTSYSWQPPAGLDATLTLNAAQPGYDQHDYYDASTFTLNFRHSGVTETFTAPAQAIWKVARLSTVKDRNGNTLSYSYNGSGQLTSITDSYGATTSISWSPEGFVSQITDPSGRHYRYYQNGDGQLIQYEDPDGNSTYYSYDENGNLTQVKTPAGNITNFTYEPETLSPVQTVQRLVSPTDSDGPTTTYQLATASGTCTQNPGAMQDTVSDPDNHVTTYCTDPTGRLIDVKNAAGKDQNTSYNNTAGPGYGYVKSTSDQLNIPTAFTYSNDSDDNITQAEYGNSSGTGASAPISSSFTYGSGANQYLPASSKDNQNHTTTYGYDANGNTQSITDPLSSQNQASYTYNSNGTIATSTDQDGNETTYGYTAGNLTSITPPTGSGLNATTLTYDSDNRVATDSTINSSAGTGNKVTYAYNGLDQITEETWQNASGSSVQHVNYTYDDDGNLTQVADGVGSITYAYDGLNRVTTSWDSATDETVNYAYDPASNLTTLHDGSGTVTYTYNNLNQVTAVQDPTSSNAHAHLTYDADGNLLSTTYASGASDVNTYNALEQLTKTTDTYKTSTGALAHLTYTYTYNADGLKASMVDQNNNTTAYGYDALDRLTSAVITPSGTMTPSQEYQYTYDGNGNLTQKVSGAPSSLTTTAYKYNSANEICWSYPGTNPGNTCSNTPSGGQAYSFDPDGNETAAGSNLTMSYNQLNQMNSATLSGTASNYSYFGSGQNELSADGSNTLGYSSQGLYTSINGSNTTTYSRTPSGQLVDERTSAGTYDYLYDGDGNIVGLTDGSDHLVDQYAYSPYGSKTLNTGTVTNPFGFQTGYTAASGLIHFGARFYNPGQGSWTQQDPLDQIDDVTQDDRYGFESDDPINGSDAAGESFKNNAGCALAITTFAFGSCFGSVPPNASFSDIQQHQSDYAQESASELAEIRQRQAENIVDQKLELEGYAAEQIALSSPDE